MTMRQLALLAGVSISTVSKAFRDAGDVSEETKDRIFALAKENGCYGKFYKDNFHKKTYAIIFPELESAFYSDYVRRLQKFIESNHGMALMSVDNFDKEKQAELIDYYASYLKVDGIFVISLRTVLKRGYETPIVSLLTSSTERDVVRVDIRAAMQDAVLILKENGHENIAFLGEQQTLLKAKVFSEVYKTPLQSENIITSEQRFQKAGEDGINQLLTKEKFYTAIICAYDDLAYGAIRQLKKCGYSVPEDVSVIGIDNIPASEYTETPLTSIDFNSEQICENAWKLMAKKIQNRFYCSVENVVVPARLVLRETVGKRK